MVFSLRTFREQYHLTQTEMARELNLKPGTYAMIERNERTFPKSLHAAFSALQAKYHAGSGDEPANTENLNLTALRKLAEKKQSMRSVRIEGYKREMELTKLENDLRSYKKKFKNAKHLIEMADVQLAIIEDNDANADVILTLKYKRNKAISDIKFIIKEDPVLMAVKIKALKAEILVYNKFAEELENTSLDFDPTELLK